MSKLRFDGDFTQQDALPSASIEAANVVLGHARLHRYNTKGDECSEVQQLESEFAAWQGARYCLALTSCGQALQIALRTLALNKNEPVLTNAFTLAPVPGAIAAVGARPIFVETTRDLVIDANDLASKARQHQGAVLLLSHMRGNIGDLDTVLDIVKRYRLRLVEDCAHTMGVRWKEHQVGNLGQIGCFSTQTYKHLNSGEGGFLTSNHAELIAKATLLSGSYMWYGMHGAGPSEVDYEAVRESMPNLSARMDNLRAAILRPQLIALNARIHEWEQRYTVLEQRLRCVNGIYVPKRMPQAQHVGSSFQFLIPELTPKGCERVIDTCRQRGVVLKWFGAPRQAGFTSTYRHWRYAEPQSLAQTDAITAVLFDMRIPLTFSLDDCELIAYIIGEEVGGALEHEA